MHHQSQMPYSYYDTATGNINLKLHTNSTISTARVYFGDPFDFVQTTRPDAYGGYIWDWNYSEVAMSPQYTCKESITWQVSFPPTQAKRLKYMFAITDTTGKEIFYGENGVCSGLDSFTSFFFFPHVHEIDAIKMPEWASNVCWYQIFPERFKNGNPAISPANAEGWETGKPAPRNFFGGDLYGIIEKLPYIHELGFTGIYLTPLFTSPSNHKYDTEDYFAIDPHFGDKKKLKELVQKAHALGIKVMLDAVFNHIGSNHVFWQDVLKNQEKSKYKDYFHIHSFPVADRPRREELTYSTFAFASSMPKWNTEHPEVRQHLIDVGLYWINECDIDGWRLDVSDEVSFSFWHDFRKAINKVKPEVFVLGEVWHDPAKWLNGGYFDAVMNYYLGYLMRDLFAKGEITPDEFTQRLFAKLSRFSDIHKRVSFNLLDSHDTARILTQSGGNKLGCKNAFLFMMLMPGAPCIYYGTEVGMEGADDPDCRCPMIWDEAKQDLKLQTFFKKLIALRKEHNKLIQNAEISYVKEKNLCRWTLGKGSERLQLVYNISDSNIKLEETILLSTEEDVNGVLPAGVLALCTIS